MKVLVTGGAGFIGANLCRMLAARPDVDHVLALDDLTTGSAVNLQGVEGVDLVHGSILDDAALASAAADASAIVHLAARPSVPMSLADPVATHEVNVTGTVKVLETARRTGAYVVAASSSAVYGDTEVTPKHEGLPQLPLSPYGASKVATETYATSYAHAFGLETLALRFFNVFGPLQPPGHAYAAVVPAFVDAALAHRAIPIYGDGRQVRDFVFVDTVAGVLADAATRRVTSPTPVNLASGVRTDLLTLVAELERLLGRPVDVEHLPARGADIRDSHADASRCAELFPAVEHVDLGAGLRRTVEWFRTLPR